VLPRTVQCSQPSAAARFLPPPSVVLGRSRPARATGEAVGDVARTIARYPSTDAIENLGRRVANSTLSQPELDPIVHEALGAAPRWLKK